MTAFLSLPVGGKLPRELVGKNLFKQVETVIDLTGVGTAAQFPTSSKAGESKTDFSFNKALKGIKSEAGEACSSKGDGSFPDGSIVLRQGNCVHLSANALQGENAEKTLAQLDAMQKGVRQPPPANSRRDDNIPDVGSLANILDHATNMGRPKAGTSKVHYQHVHDAVQHLLDDLGEEEGDSRARVASRAGAAGVTDGTRDQQLDEGVAAGLPLPTHSVVVLEDRVDVVIDLPDVQGPDDAQVDIGTQMVIVTVPGMYRVLKVDLPKLVSESTSKAKWSKKKKKLTIQLPYCST